MKTYVFQSDGFMYTPNVIRYARAMFHNGTRKDRAVAKRLLVEGYSVPEKIAMVVLDPGTDLQFDFDAGTVTVTA